MKGLFPANSKTGGETMAAPAIWENMADFNARFDTWGQDVAKAAAATKDLDSFKTAFGDATKSCGTCHENYRFIGCNRGRSFHLRASTGFELVGFMNVSLRGG